VKESLSEIEKLVENGRKKNKNEALNCVFLYGAKIVQLLSEKLINLHVTLQNENQSPRETIILSLSEHPFFK
jgi:hypothetical protein